MEEFCKKKTSPYPRRSSSCRYCSVICLKQSVVRCSGFWGVLLRIESLCFPSGCVRDAIGILLYITLPFIIISNATLIYDTWSSSIILLFYLMLVRQLLKMQPVLKNPKKVSCCYIIFIYLCSQQS